MRLPMRPLSSSAAMAPFSASWSSAGCPRGSPSAVSSRAPAPPPRACRVGSSPAPPGGPSAAACGAGPRSRPRRGRCRSGAHWRRARGGRAGRRASAQRAVGATRCPPGRPMPTRRSSMAWSSSESSSIRAAPTAFDSTIMGSMPGMRARRSQHAGQHVADPVCASRRTSVVDPSSRRCASSTKTGNPRCPRRPATRAGHAELVGTPLGPDQVGVAVEECMRRRRGARPGALGSGHQGHRHSLGPRESRRRRGQGRLCLCRTPDDHGAVLLAVIAADLSATSSRRRISPPEVQVGGLLLD